MPPAAVATSPAKLIGGEGSQFGGSEQVAIANGHVLKNQTDHVGQQV
jgi:hypothetical protein